MKFINTPKKSLGQNFLTDKNIINNIVKIGNITKNKTILEIGPGYGHLTKKIVSMKPKKIYAVEKDKKLTLFLKENFKQVQNIEIINNDIMNFIKQNKLENEVIVYGNLPYNLSTQILASLILLKKWPPWYECLILMFQKEVAERILAKTKNKMFGRLAILCNWRFEIKKHFDISPNCFSPKPNVSSTTLSFKPIKSKFDLKNPQNLEKITRVLFSSRRKMINKNFKKLFGNKNFIADELELDLNLRPEQLSCEMFYKIAMKYE